MKKLISLVLMFMTTNAHAVLPYQVLRWPSSGNIATYGAVDLSQSNAVTGILSNANTTATSANTASAIVARDGSGNFSAGTITATLSGTATNVTGTVAIANGGTGQTTQQAAINALTGSQTNAFYLRSNGTNATLSALAAADLTGQVAVANGGTGASSLAANNVILGNGTSAVQVVAPGSSGNVLTSDGTTWLSASNSAAPAHSNEISNVSFATSVSGNAFTIALKQADGSSDCTAPSPCKIGFRSSTATSAAFNQRSVTGSLSITIPSSTTIGSVSAVAETYYFYAIDNAGTPELAVSLSNVFDEGSLVSTSAISGGTARGTLYSTTARSNVPVRFLGRFVATETTAGTWASNASEASVNPVKRLKPVLQANFASNCSWSTTSSSFVDPSDDGTCTVTFPFNRGFGTVTNTGGVKPGITFTAPQLGIMEICTTTTINNGSANQFALFQVTDGTSVISNGDYRDVGGADGVTRETCGYYNVTSTTSSTTIKVQIAISGGTTNLTSQVNANTVVFKLKYLE